MFDRRFFLVNFVLFVVFLSDRVENFDFSRRNFLRELKNFKSNDVDPGPALFLTPLIEQGQIELARNLSQVKIEKFPSIRSFSGFFTVNKTCGSNIFFWFFPSQNDVIEAPLIVWLQGGPGTTSTFGLFVENGPIFVDENEEIFQRNLTWNSKNHLLYIDQPVGTGFSFTEDDRCYATSQDQIDRDLYSTLTQFFQVFPEFIVSDFFVSGESYAGKFVPSIFYKIHQENPLATIKINLKGIMIGNGLVDPINQWSYGNSMRQIGLIDDEQFEFIELLSMLGRQAIEENRYKDAYQIFNEIFDEFYSNKTGLIDAENYLRTNFPDDLFYFIGWLLKSENRRTIHVGNSTFNDGQKVQTALENDAMKSIAEKLRFIANENYRILIYNGLLDLIIPISSTENWIEKLRWNGSENFQNSKRQIFQIDQNEPKVIGYVKSSGNFSLAFIRNAGHSTPYDQPISTYYFIDRFINGSSTFDKFHND